MTIVRIANTLKLTTTVSLQRSQVSKKMSTNCIFCKIISGEVQGDIVYQDQEIIIFKDIKPASTYHYLACPKEHIGNINSLKRSDIPLVENLMERGKQVLQSNGADLNHVLMGFHKPPFNTISHLHLHLISPSLQMSYLHKIMFKPGTWWFVDADTMVQSLNLKL